VISYSLKHVNCSWFANCDLTALKQTVAGFRSAAVRPARSSAEAINCDHARPVRTLDSERTPRIVWQTYRSHTLSPGAEAERQALIANNADWTFYLHNDSEAHCCFRQYSPALEALGNRILPGVARADLWRYCVLYLYGGVYIDVDSAINDRHKSLRWLPRDGLVASLEHWGTPGTNGRWPEAWYYALVRMIPLVYGVHWTNFSQIPGQQVRKTALAKRYNFSHHPFGQWMLAAPPRHILFKHALDDMIAKLSKWKDTADTMQIKMAARICWLTGPYALTTIIERLLWNNEMVVSSASTGQEGFGLRELVVAGAQLRPRRVGLPQPTARSGKSANHAGSGGRGGPRTLLHIYQRDFRGYLIRKKVNQYSMELVQANRSYLYRDEEGPFFSDTNAGGSSGPTRKRGTHIGAAAERDHASVTARTAALMMASYQPIDTTVKPCHRHRGVASATPSVQAFECVSPPMDEDNRRALPESHLLHWRGSIFSQFGADGVIHKLFSDLGVESRRCDLSPAPHPTTIRISFPQLQPP
jgi:hypothetical protein